MTNPTAQHAIDALVERGILVEATGRRRNRFYFAQGIYDALYGRTIPAAEPVSQPTLFE